MSIQTFPNSPLKINNPTEQSLNKSTDTFSKLNTQDFQKGLIFQVSTESGSTYQFTVLENLNNEIVAEWSGGTKTLKGLKGLIHGETIEAGKQLFIGRGRTSMIKEVKVISQPQINTTQNNKLLHKLQSISDINSFESLQKYLHDLPAGTISGSKASYTLKDLSILINKVRLGELSSQYITRNHGLRTKVEELLKKENRLKASSSEQASLQIDSNIHLAFQEIAQEKYQPQLTRELLSNSDFIPHDVINIQGKQFFIGKIIQTDGRDQALMFIKNEHNQLVPRILYKSQSDGGWRSCPGFTGRAYSKGMGIHYTQETKPHEEILKYLDNNTNNTAHYSGDLIKDKFNLFNDTGELPEKLKDVYTYPSETSLYADKGVLQQFQLYSPGYGFTDGNPKSYFENLDFSSPELKGFMPNFSTPTKSMKLNHTLLGETTLETFIAKLNNRSIEWTMAYDSQGRVWIDSIKFSDDESSINSYGVVSEIIDSGLLTNKPIEYTAQAKGLQYGLDILDFNGLYSDITPLLDNLQPIQNFRNARNIYKNSKIS